MHVYKMTVGEHMDNDTRWEAPAGPLGVPLQEQELCKERNVCWHLVSRWRKKQGPEPDPNPIRKSVVRIPRSGFVLKFHGSTTMLTNLPSLIPVPKHMANMYRHRPLLISNNKCWFRAQRQSEAYATDNYILTMLNQLPPTKELLQVGLTYVHVSLGPLAWTWGRPFFEGLGMGWPCDRTGVKVGPSWSW